MSYHCPSCGSKLEFVIRPKFCPECGNSTVPGAARKTAPQTSSAAEDDGEIHHVPQITKLQLSFDNEDGNRSFDIQDLIHRRVEGGGRQRRNNDDS